MWVIALLALLGAANGTFGNLLFATQQIPVVGAKERVKACVATMADLSSQPVCNQADLPSYSVFSQATTSQCFTDSP